MALSGLVKFAEGNPTTLNEGTIYFDKDAKVIRLNHGDGNIVEYGAARYPRITDIGMVHVGTTISSTTGVLKTTDNGAIHPPSASNTSALVAEHLDNSYIATRTVGSRGVFQTSTSAISKMISGGCVHDGWTYICGDSPNSAEGVHRCYPMQGSNAPIFMSTAGTPAWSTLAFPHRVCYGAGGKVVWLPYASNQVLVTGHRTGSPTQSLQASIYELNDTGGVGKYASGVPIDGYGRGPKYRIYPTVVVGIGYVRKFIDLFYTVDTQTILRLRSSTPLPPSPVNAYMGGVFIPQTKQIVLVPYQSTTVDIYDIASATVIKGPAHGITSITPYFSGGCLLDNGRVVFNPFNSPVVGLYDWQNREFVRGPEITWTAGRTRGAVALPGGARFGSGGQPLAVNYYNGN
jgi:hypothetical protein